MALPQTEQSTELREKVRWAMGFLNDKSDYERQGVFAKLGITNPFDQWPPDEESLIKLFDYFQTTTPAPEYVETITPMLGSQQSIDTKKLDDLIAVFDREMAEAQAGRATTTNATKKFVAALKENAKKANVTLAETQTPVPPETTGAPVAPERVREIISATVQQTLPAEEKELFFHALTSFASERPAQSITNLVPRAASVTEATRVLVSPEEIIPKDALFSPRAAALFQQLSTVVNHPDLIPKTTLADMTARWGENFVNSPWFTKLQTDANRMIADQKAAANIMGKVSSLFSDVSTAVFRGPIDPGVITFIDIGYIAPQIQITSPSHFAGIALDYGGQLVRMGGEYVLRAGVGAGIKKAAISGATKLGIEAATGIATGGTSWLVMAATNALGWLKDKTIGVFKNLIGMGTSRNPEDNLLLVIGGAVVLIFFLPLFPLLNIPAFNQSMIDTAMVTGIGAGEGGPGGANGYTTAVGPIGSTTRSCANTSGILLHQCSSPGGGIPFKSAPGCTVCRGGCGPTATAMILHAFGSSSTVPNVAGRVAAQDINKYHNYACSSWIQSNLAIMQEEGLRTVGIGLDWGQADKYLKACGLVFALGNTPTSGHFVVITGINWDTSGKNVVSYATLDPYYPYTTQTSSTFRVTDMFAVVHK